MADSRDVENALVSMISAILMPSGYKMGLAETSLLGPVVRLYRGWPVRKQLDDDLAAMGSHVTIFPRAEEQNLTRYDREWQVLVPAVHGITAAITGLVVTFGGSVGTANVGLIVDGVGYIVSPTLSDTLTTLATAFAGLIPGATSAGPSVTLANASQILIRVGGFATMVRELKRQLRNYQIIFWTPTPDLRDVLAGPVDVALAEPQWVTLPDFTTGRLRYHNSWIDDELQKAGVFRRDLVYSVEYPTVQTMLAPEVIIAQADLSMLPPPIPAVPPVPFVPPQPAGEIIVQLGAL